MLRNEKTKCYNIHEKIKKETKKRKEKVSIKWKKK